MPHSCKKHNLKNFQGNFFLNHGKKFRPSFPRLAEFENLPIEEQKKKA